MSTYGRRLLPHLVDERAAQGHQRPVASLPLSSIHLGHDPLTAGYVDVSYYTFALAIDRLAIWLLNTFGLPQPQFEPFVYLAPTDWRYQILILASAKAGYVPFLVSPRNSDIELGSLLQECNATKFLTDRTHPTTVPAVRQILRLRPTLHCYDIPPLAVLLAADTPLPQNVPLNATWEEYRHVPLLQIQTSGSTGSPKLITIRHGSLSALDGFHLLEKTQVKQRMGYKRMCCAFPPFHIAGIVYGLFYPSYMDSTAITLPPGPITADVVDRAHVRGRAEMSNLMPSLVADLVKDLEQRANLSMLTAGITFGGGPLAEDVAAIVNEIAPLATGYGSGELIAIPNVPKDREDWSFVRFDEEGAGVVFRHQGMDLYELGLVRNTNAELVQAVFVTFLIYRSSGPKISSDPILTNAAFGNTCLAWTMSSFLVR